MRVIAGESRGRQLKAPRGMRTRPTSDLLRGTIFSMLASMDIRPATVLDLYAGSGALGIEALSRGADSADFVEQDRAACAVIHENLARTRYTERAHVYCLPVQRCLGRLSEAYNLVFLDPPYYDLTIGAVLSRLTRGPIIGQETTIVYEHSKRTQPPAAIGPLPLAQTRSHGTSSISFYRPDQPIVLGEETFT